MKPTTQVSTDIYQDSHARDWLAIRGCLLSPNGLGGLEIVFESDQIKTEFCLMFGHYLLP